MLTRHSNIAAEVLKSLKTNAVAPLTETPFLLPGGLREDAPALTLFDNAVISRKDGPAEVSRAQYNKSKALTRALTSLLPSPQDLDSLLNVSTEWWTVWRKMFPEIADRRCETIKEAVSHSLRSANPAEVAKMIVCIAISIDQIPPSWDSSCLHLGAPPRDLMERYISTVEKLVISDDEIAATLDGIECMVLQAKYHINLGRPRRAWLIFQRATSFAELLGLHRLSSRKPVDRDPQYERQVSLWIHLIQGDRYMSLILGLPYKVSEQFCAPFIPKTEVPLYGMTSGEFYLLRMMPIITKMVDRNQNPDHMPFSATLRIDQELEELARSMPSSWWTLSRVPGSSVEDHFDRLSAQFFHHQGRVLLHMPFMLKAATDKRFQYSHNTALESARELIRYFQALRCDEAVGPYICKLMDFQAFTAAMLILLNLLGYAQQVRGSNAMPGDAEQDQRDSDLVDVTIKILHTASAEAGGIVAAQSAKALEMLAQARHCADSKDCKESDTCQVSIPYFGTVTIGAGKHFNRPKPGTFPKSGEPRRQSMPIPAANTGLPTPPSLYTHSSQQSPTSVTIDNPSCASTTQFANNAFVFPVQDPATFAEDPFISFDSFMPMPHQDFPSSMGFGAAPQAYPCNNDWIGGFPFGGGSWDLDQSWTWSGTDGIPAPQQ